MVLQRKLIILKIYLGQYAIKVTYTKENDNNSFSVTVDEKESRSKNNFSSQ